ncbi:MAG: hypothetical protein JNM59_06700 [Hyphomonadaceae bacterium]|nr:hypothetical protein [Hyphomonadaceae bacterium]
MRCALCIATPR